MSWSLNPAAFPQHTSGGWRQEGGGPGPGEDWSPEWDGVRRLLPWSSRSPSSGTRFMPRVWAIPSVSPAAAAGAGRVSGAGPAVEEPGAALPREALGNVGKQQGRGSQAQAQTQGPAWGVQGQRTRWAPPTVTSVLKQPLTQPEMQQHSGSALGRWSTFLGPPEQGGPGALPRVRRLEPGTAVEELILTPRSRTLGGSEAAWNRAGSAALRGEGHVWGPASLRHHRSVQHFQT